MGHDTAPVIRSGSPYLGATRSTDQTGLAISTGVVDPSVAELGPQHDKLRAAITGELLRLGAAPVQLP
jgi:hypothetical protein